MTVSISGTNGITFPDSSLQAAAASPYVLKNRIINGAFVIDQRNAGASVTPINGQYTLDRWNTGNTQTGKYSVQQNAGSITPPVGFSNYLGVTSASSYSVISTDYFLQYQPIEGYNFADLGWGTANAKTITISFQVYSSLTGTFGGTLLNGAGNRCYVFSYSIPVANTWTTISVTIAGDTTGTWVGATNGVGCYVFFSLGAGSSVSGTAGSWGSTLYRSVTGATSVVGTNGATFYITGVQLEIGSTATPFECRLYNQELAACQRYTFKRLADGSVDDYAPLGLGRYYATNSAQLYVPFPVTMRTSPSSVTVSGNILVNDTGLGGSLWTSPVFNETSCDGATLTGSATTGTTAGYATTFYANTTSVAYIIFNAEL